MDEDTEVMAAIGTIGAALDRLEAIAADRARAKGKPLCGAPHVGRLEQRIASLAIGFYRRG